MGEWQAQQWIDMAEKENLRVAQERARLAPWRDEEYLSIVFSPVIQVFDETGEPIHFEPASEGVAWTERREASMTIEESGDLVVTNHAPFSIQVQCNGRRTINKVLSPGDKITMSVSQKNGYVSARVDRFAVAEGDMPPPCPSRHLSSEALSSGAGRVGSMTPSQPLCSSS